ncbi:MAG: error-prone polymerase, partial [Acidimicrobiaceae bacterium]
WLKRYYPAAFCAGLLNAQPMGFYSPHSLVQDARRHGVDVHTPDLNASDWNATLEPAPTVLASQESASGLYGRQNVQDWQTWGIGGPAVRLGIGSVRGIGDDLAKQIAAGRPYESMEDLQRRVPKLDLAHLEAMATAGVFGSFDVTRREALWGAGAVAQSGPDRLAGIVTGVDAPTLPGMSRREEAIADLWATGVSPDGHPTRFVREHLDALGAVPASGLAAVPTGDKVLVGGVVTHRQRPATAQGTIFINLEDETGLINVVCSKGCWVRHRRVARSCPALLIRGRLEKHEGVINVVAERIEPLPLDGATKSRDFR